MTSAAVEAVAARSGQDARSAAGSAGEGVEALTHTRGGAVRLELRSAAAQTEGNVGKNLVAFEKKLF